MSFPQESLFYSSFSRDPFSSAFADTCQKIDFTLLFFSNIPPLKPSAFPVLNFPADSHHSCYLSGLYLLPACLHVKVLES